MTAEMLAWKWNERTKERATKRSEEGGKVIVRLGVAGYERQRTECRIIRLPKPLSHKLQFL
jgi:hypothetical protein